jgi:hypothetical protein
MNTFTLENKTLTLIFGSECGILAGLSSKLTGWEILNRPHLGLSFRLLLPLPGRRNNPVFGEKQKLTALEIGEDGRTATFFWDGVTSEYGGDHAIRLTARVTLTDFQAIFSIQIENYSDYIVENVYYPYLGDVQHVPGDKWLRGFLYDYATAHEWPIWPEYRNLRGYHGMDFPTQFSPWSGFAGTPMSPFFLLRGQNQGLYTGAVAPESELMVWHTELRPGWSTAMTSQVPENLTISGKNVATRFAAVHVPFLQPGESRILIPVAMQAYQGDWHAGVDIYKTWRSGWMTKVTAPEWARQPHSWQVFQLNSPEDDLRMPFKNLVKVGEDSARQGIKALHLIGWNNGGQDQGNPSHDPDPRLGNLGDLKEAIVKIQAMGVKVILFTKFTWAYRATEWFRKDLVRLSIKDPYGDYYLYPGYQYQTATQLLDINTKRLIPMCF